MVDRSAGLGGAQAPVASEVKAAMYGAGASIFNFIGGLAGRDISDGSFRRIFSELLDVKDGRAENVNTWFDLVGDPMSLREVDVVC